jgi:type IV secretory pathway VirB2 component (pilin)
MDEIFEAIYKYLKTPAGKFIALFIFISLCVMYYIGYINNRTAANAWWTEHTQ